MPKKSPKPPSVLWWSHYLEIKMIYMDLFAKCTYYHIIKYKMFHMKISWSEVSLLYTFPPLIYKLHYYYYYNRGQIMLFQTYFEHNVLIVRFWWKMRIWSLKWYKWKLCLKFPLFLSKGVEHQPLQIECK